MSRGGRWNGGQSGRGRGGGRGNWRGRGRGGGGGGGRQQLGSGGGNEGDGNSMMLDELVLPTGPRRQNQQSYRGRGTGGGLGFVPSAGSFQSRPTGNRGNGRGSSQNGRGRGRGGGVLAAQNQHAVGFDYTSIHRRARVEISQYSTVQDSDDAQDSSDVVIEPRKGYLHVVKPHLENSMPSSRQTSGPSSSRASPSPEEHSRAERIRSGQVAAIIPTTKQSTRLYGIYKQDLPVFKATTERKKKDPFFVRPPQDDPFDDACMGGIPRHLRKRPQKYQRESMPHRFENEQRHPPTFVKAKGSWADGKWTREDGQEGSLEVLEKRETGIPALENNVGMGGIGYVGKVTEEEPVMDMDFTKELAEYGDGLEGEENAVQSLLQQFPGSVELIEGETVDSTLDWYKSPDVFIAAQLSSATPSHQSQPKLNISQDVEEDVLVNDTASVALGANPVEKDKDEDEVIILIPKNEDSDHSTGQQSSGEAGENTDLFFVDTDGQADVQQQEIVYETVTEGVLGEVDAGVANNEGEWHSDLEDYDAVPKSQGKKGRNATKKARRRARQALSTKPPLVPREGDSDVEWGSDGPPPIQFYNKTDQAGFMAQDDELMDLAQLQEVVRANHAPKTAAEEEGQLAMALRNSLADSRPSSSVRRSKTKQRGGETRQSHKDVLLEDYMQNALGLGADAEDGDDVEAETRDETLADKQTELDAMLRFMQGMDGQRHGRETTMADIEIEQQLQEEEDWMTDSDNSNAESGAEEIFGQEEKQFAEADVESDSDSEADSTDASSSGDDRYADDDDDGDSDSDEDDEEENAFSRNFTWAEEDEDFIARIDKFASANDGILKGRNRGARNKLFKAIESGDFAMMDGGANGGVDDLDDVDLAGLRPAKKRGKKWRDDDPLAQQMQAQWDKDRAKKADNKRKRAELRALEAQNPFPNTNGKGKGAMKKTLKKAARAARRAERLEALQTDGREDGVDMVDALFGGRGILRDPLMNRHATSLLEVDRQIELFLEDRTKTTLSLPPMDKRLRAQVHQLAMCYNVTSKSQGAGNNRFPTLIKNSRSAIPARRGRINALLRSTGSLGSGGSNKYGNDRSSAAGRKTAKERVPLPRNQEGAEVGFGAERIGQENVGHRLLLAMGWTEGSGVGATQGMSEPVGATIKISKGGLGF